MEYLAICMEQCHREMTVKDILTNRCCNNCDVPYIYLKQLPAENEKLMEENQELKKQLKELIE